MDEQTSEFFAAAPLETTETPKFSQQLEDTEYIGDVTATSNEPEDVGFAAEANFDEEPIVLVPPEAEGAADAFTDEYSHQEFAAPPVETGEMPPADVLVLPEPETETAALVLAGEGEETPMQKFNAEFQVTLKERKDAENAAKAEALAAAETDLKEFLAQREAKREAKMSQNRAEEQSKLETMELELEKDNSWQRVSKLVDLTHDSAQDVKRMRDLFIALKNDATKAEILV